MIAMAALRFKRAFLLYRAVGPSAMTTLEASSSRGWSDAVCGLGGFVQAVAQTRPLRQEQMALLDPLRRLEQLSAPIGLAPRRTRGS